MKRFFSGFGLGFKMYGEAIAFIFSKGLAWYFIFPVLLTLLIFFGGYAAVNQLADIVETEFFSWVDVKSWDFPLADVLGTALSWLIWLVFKIIFYFMFAFFGGSIVLMLMSPVLANLSEKTEGILTGKNYPFSADRLMRDMVRGILIAMRNMAFASVFLILFFIVGFIPVIGWLSPFGLFLVGAYFYGFSFMDYSNERKQLSINQSVVYIRRNKGFAVSNGAVFGFFLLVPLIGTLMAGFISIVAVVAATLGVNAIDQKDQALITSENK